MHRMKPIFTSPDFFCRKSLGSLICDSGKQSNLKPSNLPANTMSHGTNQSIQNEVDWLRIMLTDNIKRKNVQQRPIHLIYSKSVFIYLFIYLRFGVTHVILKEELSLYSNSQSYWLVVWVLWHINLCKLFNAKSIFIQIISSISNNLV